MIVMLYDKGNDADLLSNDEGTLRTAWSSISLSVSCCSPLVLRSAIIGKRLGQPIEP